MPKSNSPQLVPYQKKELPVFSEIPFHVFYWMLHGSLKNEAGICRGIAASFLVLGSSEFKRLIEENGLNQFDRNSKETFKAYYNSAIKIQSLHRKRRVKAKVDKAEKILRNSSEGSLEARSEAEPEAQELEARPGLISQLEETVRKSDVSALVDMITLFQNGINVKGSIIGQARALRFASDMKRGSGKSLISGEIIGDVDLLKNQYSIKNSFSKNKFTNFLKLIQQQGSCGVILNVYRHSAALFFEEGVWTFVNHDHVVLQSKTTVERMVDFVFQKLSGDGCDYQFLIACCTVFFQELPKKEIQEKVLNYKKIEKSSVFARGYGGVNIFDLFVFDFFVFDLLVFLRSVMSQGIKKSELLEVLTRKVGGERFYIGAFNGFTGESQWLSFLKIISKDFPVKVDLSIVKGWLEEKNSLGIPFLLEAIMLSGNELMELLASHFFTKKEIKENILNCKVEGNSFFKGLLAKEEWSVAENFLRRVGVERESADKIKTVGFSNREMSQLLVGVDEAFFMELAEDGHCDRVFQIMKGHDLFPPEVVSNLMSSKIKKDDLSHIKVKVLIDFLLGKKIEDVFLSPANDFISLMVESIGSFDQLESLAKDYFNVNEPDKFLGDGLVELILHHQFYQSYDVLRSLFVLEKTGLRLRQKKEARSSFCSSKPKDNKYKLTREAKEAVKKLTEDEDTVSVLLRVHEAGISADNALGKPSAESFDLVPQMEPEPCELDRVEVGAVGLITANELIKGVWDKLNDESSTLRSEDLDEVVSWGVYTLTDIQLFFDVRTEILDDFMKIGAVIYQQGFMDVYRFRKIAYSDLLVKSLVKVAEFGLLTQPVFDWLSERDTKIEQDFLQKDNDIFSSLINFLLQEGVCDANVFSLVLSGFSSDKVVNSKEVLVDSLDKKFVISDEIISLKNGSWVFSDDVLKVKEFLTPTSFLFMINNAESVNSILSSSGQFSFALDFLIGNKFINRDVLLFLFKNQGKLSLLSNMLMNKDKPGVLLDLYRKGFVSNDAVNFIVYEADGSAVGKLSIFSDIFGGMGAVNNQVKFSCLELFLRSDNFHTLITGPGQEDLMGYLPVLVRGGSHADRVVSLLEGHDIPHDMKKHENNFIRLLADNNSIFDLYESCRSSGLESDVLLNLLNNNPLGLSNDNPSYLLSYESLFCSALICFNVKGGEGFSPAEKKALTVLKKNDLLNSKNLDFLIDDVFPAFKKNTVLLDMIVKLENINMPHDMFLRFIHEGLASVPRAPEQAEPELGVAEPEPEMASGEVRAVNQSKSVGWYELVGMALDIRKEKGTFNYDTLIKRCEIRAPGFKVPVYYQELLKEMFPLNKINGLSLFCCSRRPGAGDELRKSNFEEALHCLGSVSASRTPCHTLSAP